MQGNGQKISAKSQLGLGFDGWMKEDVLRMQHEKYLQHVNDASEVANAVVSIEELFSEKDNKNYFFRNTALQVASKIKLNKLILEDFSFLAPTPVKKSTYLLGKNKFYRWHRWEANSDILVICVKLIDTDEAINQKASELQDMFGMTDAQMIAFIQKRLSEGAISKPDAEILMHSVRHQDFRNVASKGLFYYMWGINPTTGQLLFPSEEINADFQADVEEFVRLLVFTELSELETVELKPNQKTGTKREGKYINESNKNVTIVDSTWNKILFRGEGFKVSGHLRMQPFGPDKKLRKLIFIEDFEKTGYTKTVSA